MTSFWIDQINQTSASAAERAGRYHRSSRSRAAKNTTLTSTAKQIAA